MVMQYFAKKEKKKLMYLHIVNGYNNYFLLFDGTMTFNKSDRN